jgi:hypothetical protein
MRGRYPKTAADKALSGNPGRRPLTESQKPSAQPPKPTWPLCPRAQQFFDVIVSRLAEIDQASATYSETITLTANALEEAERMDTLLRKEGITYQTVTQTGGIMFRKRPEVEIRNEAIRLARHGLTDLNLNAASLMRLKVPPTKIVDERDARAERFFGSLNRPAVSIHSEEDQQEL